MRIHSSRHCILTATYQPGISTLTANVCTLKRMYRKVPPSFPRFPLLTTEPMLGLNTFTESSSVPPFSLIQPSLGALNLQDPLRSPPYSSITAIWNKPHSCCLRGSMTNHPADNSCPLLQSVYRAGNTLTITRCFLHRGSPATLIKAGML